MNVGALGVRSHLVGTVVAVVALGFGVMYVVTGQLLDHSLRADRQVRSQWVAATVAADLTTAADTAEQTRRLEQWAGLLPDGCIGTYDVLGRPLGTTRDELLRCVGEERLPELGRASGTSWISDEHGPHVAVGVELTRDDQSGDAWLVVYVSPLGETEQRITVVRTLLLLFMALAVVLVSVLGYAVLTQLIVRPLNRLRRAMGRVQAGEFDVAASPGGGRELEDLAAAFNELTVHLRTDEKRIAHQISELKLMNERLAQAKDNLVRSEKLASVGKLAAGVAHEIGNPISIVVGYLEMLRRPDCSAEERELYLEQCTEAIHRISAIIRDLLDFSRPEKGGDVGRADIRKVVEQSAALMRPQKPFKTVTLTVQIVPDDSVPLIAAIEERRLQQVIVNLLMNAADAIVGRGGRSPRVSEDSPDRRTPEPRIQLIVDRRDDRILIRVVDNGPGIPHSARAKIFDPFFTTKEPGRGTGLGLAISYSIITASGGDIRLDTKAGEGTCFTLDLATTV